MNTLWTHVLYKPLANALLFLVAVLPGGNIGLAVILLTVLVKLVLLPLSYQSMRTQIAQKKIQPQLDEIKKTISDKQEQAKATMVLYKENGVKPFSSILILLIQLPIIIALYTVFLRGVDAVLPLAYPALQLPETIHTFFLGINLAQKSILLALLAAAAQFLQVHFSPIMRMNRTTTSTAANDPAQMMAASMQRSMKYILPVMVAFFAAVVPGAVALYWIVSSIVTLVQEIILYRRLTREKYVKVA